MAIHLVVLSWALIFIIRLRFPPGKSIATIITQRRRGYICRSEPNYILHTEDELTLIASCSLYSATSALITCIKGTRFFDKGRPSTFTYALLFLITIDHLCVPPGILKRNNVRGCRENACVFPSSVIDVNLKL